MTFISSDSFQTDFQFRNAILRVLPKELHDGSDVNTFIRFLRGVSALQKVVIWLLAAYSSV